MSLRQDRADVKAAWTVLPAEGRAGDAPPWPLRMVSDRESELWASFWAKPQAVIWERDGLVEVVALFVRQFCEAEVPKASAENRKTVRMMMSDLYLTSDSLLRAKLTIGKADSRPARASRGPQRSSRDRLRVVGSAEGA